MKRLLKDAFRRKDVGEQATLPAHIGFVLQERLLLDAGYTYSELKAMSFPELLLRATIYGTIAEEQERAHKASMKRVR